ncbi:uncharacterized protein [Parasteatoda tepidariorum]|uniref:uncharacterized protein n=1 Tax=Parasteatoda tepidariorum TaxID=114398 RepID=UPI0039BCA742
MNELHVKKKHSSAERMKKMRERKKVENQNFQAEENERFRILRLQKKKQMNEIEKLELRKYERDRKRIQRAKKKVESNAVALHATSPAYNSPRTFSKAVIKTMKALPKSPRKRAAVMAGLTKRVGMTLDKEMEKSKQSSIDYSKVINFFFRPDIIYTCPGMKDSICVWEGGEKKVLQKHYLTMFLREAFSIFKEENPTFNICFSKFCSLRPKNVLLMKNTPSEQCKCKIHENFTLKLKSLRYEYSNRFWENCLCNINLDSKCWKNECAMCQNGQLLSKPSNPAETVIWKEWEKTNNKIQLTTTETCTGALHEKIIDDLPTMMKHVHIKRIQHAEFEKDKSNQKTRIMQVDFAMSFSCEYQNEVQSALWSRATVLLFTAAVFYQNECKTFIICSDTTSKDKDTIFLCIQLLYNEVFANDTPENIPEKEVIWSDGPSSEFKNKYMVKLLHLFTEKYKKDFIWKYFATSHGKGVVDGVGGNVKRLVRQKMMAQRGLVIQSAKEFAELASTLVKSTKVFYIAEEEIKKKITECKPWEKVPSVPGIKQYHIIWWKDKKIHCKHNANDTNIIHYDEKYMYVENLNLCQGDWVVVLFDSKAFPGEIIQIKSPDEIEISVMHQAGTSGMYKWPVPTDCITYNKGEIIKKISAPIVVNNRGQFKFNEKI